MREYVLWSHEKVWQHMYMFDKIQTVSQEKSAVYLKVVVMHS